MAGIGFGKMFLLPSMPVITNVHPILQIGEGSHVEGERN
jgi:hypothetical protein